MFEVEIRRQVINDGTYRLDETERIDRKPTVESYAVHFSFLIEHHCVEGVDRVTVNIDLIPLIIG